MAVAARGIRDPVDARRVHRDRQGPVPARPGVREDGRRTTADRHLLEGSVGEPVDAGRVDRDAGDLGRVGRQLDRGAPCERQLHDELGLEISPVDVRRVERDPVGPRPRGELHRRSAGQRHLRDGPGGLVRPVDVLRVHGDAHRGHEPRGELRRSAARRGHSHQGAGTRHGGSPLVEPVHGRTEHREAPRTGLAGRERDGRAAVERHLVDGADDRVLRTWQHAPVRPVHARRIDGDGARVAQPRREHDGRPSHLGHLQDPAGAGAISRGPPELRPVDARPVNRQGAGIVRAGHRDRFDAGRRIAGPACTVVPAGAAVRRVRREVGADAAAALRHGRRARRADLRRRPAGAAHAGRGQAGAGRRAVGRRGARSHAGAVAVARHAAVAARRARRRRRRGAALRRAGRDEARVGRHWARGHRGARVRAGSPVQTARAALSPRPRAARGGGRAR